MPQYYRFLAEDFCHNGFTYKDGLNVDTLPFDPSGKCKPGGLYFTTFEHLPRHASAHWPLIADVTVPDNARVYEEPCGTKWKADQLVLSNIRSFSEVLESLDPDTLMAWLDENVHILNYVKNQTEDMCLVLMRHCGFALRYVRTQTDAICLAAVQSFGSALQYVQNKTDAICMAAVQQYGLALKYVDKQTDAICLAAVQQEACALVFVENQTEEICLAAVRQNSTTLDFVREQTEAVCLAAVEQEGLAVMFVRNLTGAISRAAVAQNPKAVHWITTSGGY